MTTTGTGTAPVQAPPARPFDRRVEAAKAGAGGVVATAAFLLGSRRLVNLNLLGCGDGLDSLGCVIAGAILAMLLAFGIGTVAGAVTLRLLRARSWLAVALAGSFSAAAVWPLVRAGAQSPTAAVVATAVAYVVMFALHSQLVVRREALRVGVTLVVAVVTFVALQPVAAKVDHALYRQERQRVVDDVVDFDVYEARTPPPGYRAQRGELWESDTTFHTHYTVVYTYGTPDLVDRPALLELKSFPVPETYRPPRDCGDFEPSVHRSVKPYPCRRVGTLPGGEPVYRGAGVGAVNNWAYYVRMGGVLVTLSTTYDLKARDAMSMLGSLEKASRERLRELGA